MMSAVVLLFVATCSLSYVYCNPNAKVSEITSCEVCDRLDLVGSAGQDAWVCEMTFTKRQETTITIILLFVFLLYTLFFGPSVVFLQFSTPFSCRRSVNAAS
jgi:hypothetical protein